MDKERTIIHCSSSISNWREKILKKYHAEEYRWWKHYREPVIFFGLYRPKDFVLCLFHRGKRIIHWQGSDILAAGWHYRWLQWIHAKHICENEVEQGVLRLMLRQEVEIRPTFLSNQDEFKITYRQSTPTKIWLHINRDAELESGLQVIKRVAQKITGVEFHVYGHCRPHHIKNVVFHGYVREEQFNQEIKGYQAAIRLHEFDGFAETISKSILLGQYPISRIRYPYVDSYHSEEDLIQVIEKLKYKKEPNYKARAYYLRKFNEVYSV